MKYFLALCLFTIVVACKPNASNPISNGDTQIGDSNDPCLTIDRTLIGTFASNSMTGTMTFSGGVSGSVDIVGADYNDMVCTYTINDCGGDKMSMRCETSAYEATFEILSRDSIKIDQLIYVRTK